jgi:2',3'-cyclic-nucleotide 2'-phosphodiesterase (5'-nucleotidase family)
VPRVKSITVFALLLLTALARSAGAATTIAAWDVSGQSGWGAQGLAPTTKDTNVTVVGLTRGAGVGTGGSAAARAWGGNTWTATTQGDAVTAGDFATFAVTAAVGFQVSFTTINPFDYRRSATGPGSGRLQYQVGGGSFVDGPAISYPTTASTGDKAGPIDLSSIAALQGVPAGTTVTFRIVNWGGTTTSGTWYIFDRAVSSAADFEIDGTIAVAPTKVGVETAADGSGSIVPGQTVPSGQSITVYAVSRQADGTFVGNAAATWSLTSVTGGVVPGDLVPAADGKSAVFTAHAGGTAVIHAAVAGLTSTDSGVISAPGTQSNPSASGQAVPPAVALNKTVLLEVAVVPGAQPTSTGIVVLGDLSALGIGGETTFHDDGQNGDLAAGDNIYSFQTTVAGTLTGGSKTIPILVNDAQGRGTTTSISLRVLGNLTVFHMNDTHARITPHKWVVPTHAPMTGPFEDVGGGAALATAVLQGTAATPDALVLDGGDISEGNPLGDMDGNLSIVQFYEILHQKLLAQRNRGVDALVVGNHDVRDASYIQHLEELNALGVPVISVNVRDISTHQPHFAPYTTITVNGIKIGILGYTTQAAAVGASLATTLEVADADWNSTDSTKIHMASYVNDLRNNQGCDMVILLTHVGHSAIATDTTVDGVATTALLVDDGTAKLPEVAVTGHWHTWAETAWQPDSLHYKTIFTESGSYMHYLGTLQVDGQGGYISSVNTPLRNSVFAPDPDVQSFINGIITQYNSTHPLAWDAVLGYTADDLLLDERMKWWSSDEYPWSGNDTAGQWISDGVQWACAQQFGSCDIAIEVGGGVRSDIPAGPVTYTQAYETYPWSDDLLWRVNMTGQDIINFITTTDCDAAFSRALHVVAHDGVPTSVTFNGAPIDPLHTYTMGITDYIYQHPPAGWTWTDPSPLTSNVLARDGLIQFMQTFSAENPYTVGGPRYDLDTQFAGQYRAVVTMMNDNDTKPAFEDGFIRLLSATPETLARRGTKPVPTNLVNADGTINQANRLSEEELYRSYLGFKLGALHPGDIIEVSGKGSFFGGDPEFVDQEGIYGDGQEFKIVGHDDALAKPTSMPSINSFLDDNHKNHYVEFLARKASSTTVTDQVGTTLKLWDATAFANKTIPGNVNDLLIIRGIPTSESYALRFRCATVDLAASQGIVDYPAASTVASHVDPVAPEVEGPTITLTATAGPNAPTRTPAPVADAQVSSGNPSTNYGTTTNLFIQSSATDGFGNERAFLRFDLSSLPAGSVITSAQLQMYNWRSIGPSLIAEAHAVANDTWGESTITFANQPTLGDTLATTTLASGNTNVWYSWDVTSYVQGEWAGDKLVSLAVKAATESAATTSTYGFDSKEFGSTAPVLRVTTQDGTATVAQVAFYYRSSEDGTTWGPWTGIGADTSAPYSTTFAFPDGYGSYEFYSIATDGHGASEGAPPAAQASTHYEAGPVYTTNAYVLLSNLTQTFSGSPLAATITTVPPSLGVDVTYDGSFGLPVHAGTYAVSATVTQPSYTGTATGTLTITQQNQAIDFGALPGVSVGSPPITLTASASSGLPVSYTSSDPSVATVSGAVVTIVGVGTTNIVASQAGNGDVLAAPSVSQPLVVSATAATVTLSNLSQTYTGAPLSATVTTSPPGLTVSVTYDGSAALPVHAGNHAVVATVTQSGYSGSASGTLAVARAAQTISFAALPPGTVGGHVTLTASSSSGLAVSFVSSNTTVATVSGNVANLLAAGTTSIIASQPGNGDYQAAPDLPQPLTVNAAGPSVPALPMGPKLAMVALLLVAGAALLAGRRRLRREP